MSKLTRSKYDRGWIVKTARILRSVKPIPNNIDYDNRYVKLMNAINTHLNHEINPNQEWVEEAIKLQKIIKPSIVEMLPIPDCLIINN